MSSRLPPRYLPTLTEVVDPSLLSTASASAAPTALDAPKEEAIASEPTALQTASGGVPVAAAPDRHALAQQLIKLVKPQLEAELRSLAQELFEAQFSALLPSMHLHIEEAVREALEQAMPAAPDDMQN